MNDFKVVINAIAFGAHFSVHFYDGFSAKFGDHTHCIVKNQENELHII